MSILEVKSECGSLVKSLDVGYKQCDSYLCDLVFFFQAEDGIRDLTVTGVQTCALPISAVSWSFFTKLPAPVGESGGGMANAIVGSAKLLLLASLIGVPIGFFGAIYLAEFSGNKIAFVVRYAADLLNGVPSIVIGIFAYALVVLPFKRFSTLAGGVALGLMMVPITLRSTEDFLLAASRSLRYGAMALGASTW